MLAAIITALQARNDLFGWTVRDIRASGAQLYLVPAGVEARRHVSDRRYIIDVVRQTAGPAGDLTAGSGTITLLRGDDIPSALDAVAAMAGLAHNRPWSMPLPAGLPDVATADPAILADPDAVLDELLARLRAAAGLLPAVRLTAAEFATETHHIDLYSSTGIEASRTETVVTAEWVLVCTAGDQTAEAFVEMTRRRAADLAIEEEVGRRALYAIDGLHTSPPPTWHGPVILRDATVATFLNAGVFHTLGSASAKYAGASTWELGHPVVAGPVQGDPLTLYATRLLPYGNGAAAFDDEGLPAGRVPLIVDQRLQTFSAAQRYADYLGLPATGAFGDIEVPPGTTPAAELLQEPYIEVAAFSWFNPDEISGDFTSEIRLGYLCDGGRRIAFTGGVLVGNVLEALANARWSSDTGFFGDYQGPVVLRFAQLTVGGEEP